VDEVHVAAEFKDGVLRVTVPKTVAAVVKPVEVKVA
jgi:HSP20 family molecular chaperone IbpA